MHPSFSDSQHESRVVTVLWKKKRCCNFFSHVVNVVNTTFTCCMYVVNFVVKNIQNYNMVHSYDFLYVYVYTLLKFEYEYTSTVLSVRTQPMRCVLREKTLYRVVPDESTFFI